MRPREVMCASAPSIKTTKSLKWGRYCVLITLLRCFNIFVNATKHALMTMYANWLTYKQSLTLAFLFGSGTAALESKATPRFWRFCFSVFLWSQFLRKVGLWEEYYYKQTSYSTVVEKLHASLKLNRWEQCNK